MRGTYSGQTTFTEALAFYAALIDLSRNPLRSLNLVEYNQGLTMLNCSEILQHLGYQRHNGDQNGWECDVTWIHKHENPEMYPNIIVGANMYTAYLNLESDMECIGDNCEKFPMCGIVELTTTSCPHFAAELVKWKNLKKLLIDDLIGDED